MSVSPAFVPLLALLSIPQSMPQPVVQSTPVSGTRSSADGPALGCLEAEVAKSDLALHRRYLYETNGRQGVRGYGGPASNASIVIPAGTPDSDRLVILWHGFMASPAEMRPLGEHLARSLGATIYIPLIPGFGSGHRIADRFKLEAWRRSLEQAIERGASCHRQIALVGYSIGGGLVAEHLLTGSIAPDDSTHSIGSIRSVVLLSPYVETARWMAPAFKSRARAGFLHVLRSVIRLRRVALERIYKLSRRRYRDLVVLLEEPSIYDQRFSLRAGINMLHLTRRLKRFAAEATTDTPTFLALSEADQTVDPGFSEVWVRRHFRQLETTVRYQRTEQIAHQIVVPSVNPKSAELFAAIASFVGRHFEEVDSGARR